MRKLVFLDLDDTLFQSRRKCPEDAAELHPIAYLRDGSAHSFMTGKQRSLWRLLEEGATLIPTTARDLDALSRVDLPFRSWRIVAYGGVILDPQGQPDPLWLARMTAASREAMDDLGGLLDAARSFIAEHRLNLRIRFVGELDLTFYLVAKYNDGREADLERLQTQLIQPWVAAHHAGYRLHRNDNNLAVLPRSLGKEHAVRYLIDRLEHEWGELVSIGIGDSLIDGAFMAECDYSITPRGSQLFGETLGRALL